MGSALLLTLGKTFSVLRYKMNVEQQAWLGFTSPFTGLAAELMLAAERSVF